MDTPPPEWQENVENLEPTGKSEEKLIALIYITRSKIFSRFQKPCSLPNWKRYHDIWGDQLCNKKSWKMLTFDFFYFLFSRNIF